MKIVKVDNFILPNLAESIGKTTETQLVGIRDDESLTVIADKIINTVKVAQPNCVIHQNSTVSLANKHNRELNSIILLTIYDNNGYDEQDKLVDCSIKYVKDVSSLP